MQISKAVTTPVWLLRQDSVLVIYKRLYGQTVLASIDDIEKLVLESKQLSFDSEFTNIKYNDNNFTKLNELYKIQNNTNNNLTTKLFQSNNLIDENNNISNALLLFSDDNKSNLIHCRH